jgi:hypothetical protein
MKVEISNGELLDKLSILNIKEQKIIDENKLQNVHRERMLLQNMSEKLLTNNLVLEQYQMLIEVNTQLWNIEDAIRLKESTKSFDNEFIELARSVYITNDLRADIKKNINILTSSYLIEEKSYKPY